MTAIEPMPVATFPGSRGWGYDGALHLGRAPRLRRPGRSRTAGRRRPPEELVVVLDAVYNHLGPGNEALKAFGPYSTDRVAATPWGETIDYTQTGVREWAIQNAELWVRDYRHRRAAARLGPRTCTTNRTRHVLAELAYRVRAAQPAARS